MVRSVLAILAGILTLTAISFGIEAIANELLLKLFPGSFADSAALSHNLAARVLMFTYTTGSIAAGAMVTAWLARRAPLQHAAAMGIVQTGFNIGVMVAMWNHAPAIVWIIALIQTLPAALLGGWLFTRHASHQHSRVVLV